MTTTITRATIAIVRVSMTRPYSVPRAVSPDPPSRTQLPLTDGLEAPRAAPRRLSLRTTNERLAPGFPRSRIPHHCDTLGGRALNGHWEPLRRHHFAGLH